MRNELGDKIRIQHIADAIEEIEKYLLEVEFVFFPARSLATKIRYEADYFL